MIKRPVAITKSGRRADGCLHIVARTRYRINQIQVLRQTNGTSRRQCTAGAMGMERLAARA